MNDQIEYLKTELLNKKDELQIELKKKYRSVRKHVREHPEKGLLIALASGVVLGVLLTKALSSKKRDD